MYALRRQRRMESRVEYRDLLQIWSETLLQHVDGLERHPVVLRRDGGFLFDGVPNLRR